MKAVIYRSSLSFLSVSLPGLSLSTILWNLYFQPPTYQFHNSTVSNHLLNNVASSSPSEICKRLSHLQGTAHSMWWDPTILVCSRRLQHQECIDVQLSIETSLIEILSRNCLRMGKTCRYRNRSSPEEQTEDEDMAAMQESNIEGFNTTQSSGCYSPPRQDISLAAIEIVQQAEEFSKMMPMPPNCTTTITQDYMPKYVLLQEYIKKNLANDTQIWISCWELWKCSACTCELGLIHPLSSHPKSRCGGHMDAPHLNCDVWTPKRDCQFQPAQFGLHCDGVYSIGIHGLRLVNTSIFPSIHNMLTTKIGTNGQFSLMVILRYSILTMDCFHH